MPVKLGTGSSRTQAKPSPSSKRGQVWELKPGPGQTGPGKPGGPGIHTSILFVVKTIIVRPISCLQRVFFPTNVCPPPLWVSGGRFSRIHPPRHTRREKISPFGIRLTSNKSHNSPHEGMDDASHGCGSCGSLTGNIVFPSAISVPIQTASHASSSQTKVPSVPEPTLHTPLQSNFYSSTPDRS